VTFNRERATSFGSVAESYDRVRPGPAAEALDWLVPRDCGLAVDVAAGTGLFTRALTGRATQVVAIEPDERMRAVLAQRSPGVRVLAGWGEQMPLPDGCADAVFVSTAWHWLDPGRAVPEIARVLRPGGRLGVVWTSRDRREDWVAELDLLRLPGIDAPARAGTPRTRDDVRARLGKEHSVTRRTARRSAPRRRRRSASRARWRSTMWSSGWRRTARSSPPRRRTGRPGSTGAVRPC
jgi:SAM-dependent methyltransferase